MSSKRRFCVSLTPRQMARVEEFKAKWKSATYSKVILRLAMIGAIQEEIRYAIAKPNL